MRRRQFITLLGGTAVAWPLGTQAQQPRTVPVIGFLHSGSAEGYAGRLAGFRQGLGETGLVEGKDFAIEFRWAEGNYERLGGMAGDLVARNVSVIVAAGGVASGPVAQAATAKIPIVFITGGDPVATGLVKSLARPEANVTGVSFLTQALGAKRLGFLNILAPEATDVAVLVNPTNPGRNFAEKEIQDAGRVSKRSIQLFERRSIPLSKPWLAGNQAPSRSPPTRFSPAVRLTSPRLARRWAFRRSIRPANIQKPAGSCPTGQMSERSIAKAASMRDGFCRAAGPRICRFCSRPNSNW
jgi:hypothetical protein